MGPLVTQSADAHTVRMFLSDDSAATSSQHSAIARSTGRHSSVQPRPNGDVRVTRRPRLDSLTGLRFFAAGIVFFHHAFELTTGTLREALQTVFGHGRAGVSFFFLLSGFVLAWSMQRGDKATSFWRRRFARIWPAYAVAAVAGYLVSRWYDGRPFSLERLAANLAMVQAWIPQKDWYFSTNAVGWSLSVEAFFYLTFPLYARYIMRLDGRRALALAGVLLGGMLAAAVWFRGDITLIHGFQLPDSDALWIIYVLPAVRILEFLLGITLVALIRQKAMPRIPVAVAWVSLGVAWVVASQVPASFAVVVVTVVPFCLLILAYAQTDVTAPGTTVWSRPAMVFLGNVSFCFYLVHQLVIRVFSSKVGIGWLIASNGLRSLKVLALLFVVSLVAAWLLHALVEKPFEKLLRPRSRRSAPIHDRAAETGRVRKGPSVQKVP
jgi:peptidoglycan/LPS O-acetylase OafA/YrhL